MRNEIAKEPAFSKQFEELIRRIEERDTVKQMSNDELKSLKRAIDNEMIRREVVKHIQILANQLK